MNNSYYQRKVSVIMPTYNSGQFIVQAVQSVLAQTYLPYEVIVVDDGSTDETKAVLSTFHDRVKYLYQENQGPSAARNKGIKMARGEYISFLDADDYWTPNKIEVQLDFLERHRDIGLVFSDNERYENERIVHRGHKLAVQMIEHEGVLQEPLQEAYTKLLKTNFICTSTVMVRKECFKKAGLFDERLRIVEDRDLWLRIAAYYKIGRLPLVLCKKRYHGNNTSDNQELYTFSQIKVLEKHLQLFPDMVPRSLINKRLSRLYLSYGYDHLLKNRKRESLKMAIHSLSLAVTIRAFELILLTFLGKSVAQSLRRINKRFI